MGDQFVDVALHTGAEHGEGPLWDAETARLWWVDIERQQVHCFDPETACDCSWPTGAAPGGVVIDQNGNPVLALPDGLSVLDCGTGQRELRVRIESDRPENRGNDAKVDGRGRVWVGTMAFDKRPRHGSLYRVDGESPVAMVPDLTISNGPAFDERAGRLYLADSGIGVVYRFDFDLETGAIDHRRLWLDFSPKGVWPDGMTVDDEGMLWVAVGRAGAVHRYDAEGRLDGLVELPTTNPTSVAFGGADGGDLFITSSRFDLEPEERPRQPLAGALLHCRPGVSGPSSPRYLRLSTR